MEIKAKEGRDCIMLEQVRTTIEKYSMLAPGDRILTGVSGGPDSVALLHVLKSLSRELGFEITVAHLNHSLRGQDSLDDASFVRYLAEHLELPVIIESADVSKYVADHGLSMQEGAREVRYRFFENTARQSGCNKLATGHNANDQAETVLSNFLRGSGPAGLGGIPPVRDGWVIRPLIETTRFEIENYCKENGLEPRTDKSNLKNIYTRNRIRLELIPSLEKEYNNNLVETLVRTSEIFREEEYYLHSQTEKYWRKIVKKQTQKAITFETEAFLDLPEAIQKRVIRKGWEGITGSVHNLSYIHLANVINLVSNARTGSSINLPLGVMLTKSYEEFVLSKCVSHPIIANYMHRLQIPGSTLVPETGDIIEASTETRNANETSSYSPDEVVIDAGLVALPLFVRNRREGDRFRPAGFDGSKKLKKFLIDSKIPRTVREVLPIVVSEEGQIVWVAGLRLDGRWLTTPNTKQIIRLKLIRNLQKQN